MRNLTAGWPTLLGIAALLCITTLVWAEETEALECLKSARFLAPADWPDFFKYAPGRELAIKHLALDVTPDFKARTVQGVATLTLKVTGKAAREVKLDAIDLNVIRVTSSEPIEAWEVIPDAVIVTFTRPVEPGQEPTVTLEYSGEPSEGLYFRTPEMGYKAGETHLFSQGETTEARHWYPCLDAPNQLFTSELTCRVPNGMTVISNGRLVEQSSDTATGLVKFRWMQDKPHANYLITLVAGYFKELKDQCGDIPLGFYTLPSEFQFASNSFRLTKGMLEYFQEETGVAYPWAKYYQVCVNDFVAGGMENTSATTLTDRTLSSPATENIRVSDGLVAHELAHQWFGDLVTCKDWSHLWLNEGFATYYETLWTGHAKGRDTMLYELYGRARNLTGRSSDPTPIVRRTFDSPGEMFNHLAYGKGGWVLHMLRSQMGEDLFRKGIKVYLERHQFGNVVTDQLRAALEEVSGMSLDRFFDQWLYHGHHPELDVRYSWDQSAKLARISIRQTQAISEKIMLFQFPVSVRFKGKFGTADFPIEVTKKEEDFFFPLEKAPETVRLDPAYTLLARTEFDLSRPMLYALLEDKADVVGRLIAIEQLSEKKDRETVEKLKRVLNRDEFYGVRVEAAKALGSIRTQEALATLLSSFEQDDARVRLEVLEAIGKFYDPRAFEACRKWIRNEKNPAIVAAGLKALCVYPQAEVRDTLLEFLNSDSFRNELAEAAIEAIRTQGDPAFIGLLLETLARRSTEFTSPCFGKGLDTLAFLARNETRKDNVREFLLTQVNHPRQRVRVAALGALGKLGDDRALAVLENVAAAGRETREQRAAATAVSELRSNRKPSDDLRNIRQEVQDLQKANRELKKELEELGKKVAAKQQPPPKNRLASPKSTVVR